MEEPEHTKKLKEALKKIGFGVRFCGADHFVIVNKKRRATEFEVFDDRVTLRSSSGSKAFGRHGKGGLSFNLRNCIIEYDEEYNMVSILPRNELNVFISFYD